MKKYFAIMFASLVRMLRPGRKFVTINFHGRDVTVLQGSVRSIVDKDDAWWACLTGNSKVIFDVGANIGYTAMLANLYGKPDRIVLIDANMEALQFALSNLGANGMLLNCTFCNAFAGEKDSDKMKFYTVGAGAAGSMFRSHAKTASALNSFFYVATLTLDSLSETLHLVPDLVKIDVEGAESFVLNGALGLGHEHATKFFIEMHATQEVPMVENARRVLEWCSKVDYNAFYLKEHILLRDPAHIEQRGKCHLLLLPASMPYPDALRDISEGSDLPVANLER